MRAAWLSRWARRLHLRSQALRSLEDDDEAASSSPRASSSTGGSATKGVVEVELHNFGQLELHSANIDPPERYFRESAALPSPDDG
jgi:hypothetical protein